MIFIEPYKKSQVFILLLSSTKAASVPAPHSEDWNNK